MTRKEIESQITLNLNDARTNTVTQIHNALDQVLRYMTYKLNITGDIRDGYIRTTSGRMQYALPEEARQVQGKFYIPETDEWLEPLDPDTFNERYPSPDSTDVPYSSILDEVYPIKDQPHSKVRLVSDNAADTMAVTVHGESYGRYLSEAVTLTGTTAVLTTNSYQRIHRVVAASAATGTITLTTNSTSGDTTLPTVAGAGDVTIATIAASATEPTNLHHPGALIRISMSADAAGDRSKEVRVEGLTIDATNNLDEIWVRETITTDASDATTSVVSTNRYTEVRAITKEWDSTNALIVTTDPGAVVVGYVNAHTRALEHQQVKFYNVPDGKSIHYRYTRHHVPLVDDGDVPMFPRLYHQVIAEWTEKLVRGLHGDVKFGIRTLEGNPEFDRAIREIKQSSLSATQDHIVLGSNWQQRQRRTQVWPIVHSTN